MRKILFFAALLLSAAAYAGEPGTEAMPFLRLDFSPASLAMGAGGPKTSAVLPFAQQELSAGASWLKFMPEISPVNYISAGLAGCSEEYGYSLAFTKGSGEKIYGTDDVPTDLAIKGGVGFAIDGQYSLGVNLGYAKQSIITGYSVSSYVIDLFAAAHYEKIDLFGGFSTLGSSVGSEETGEFPLPSSFSAGFSLPLISSGKHLLKAQAIADYYFSGTFAAGAGSEYGFAQHLFLRAGYRYGGDSVLPSFASAGFGLRFYGVELNAAYLFASEVLEKTIAIGLVFTM